GNFDHLSFSGQVKTRCKIVKMKIAVTSKPMTDSAVAQVASEKAPLKIRNSPMNPFRPGKPREEKSEMPMRPQKIGAILRRPPKSFRPRNPPPRCSRKPTNQNNVEAVRP